MNKPNDGGPAFPTGPTGDTMHYEDGRVSHQWPATEGMSLRAWLAGKALAGLSTNHDTLLGNKDLIVAFGTDGIDRLQAQKAVRLADAVIAELAKGRL